MIVGAANATLITPVMFAIPSKFRNIRMEIQENLNIGISKTGVAYLLIFNIILKAFNFM